MTFTYIYPQGLGYSTGDIIGTQGTLYSTGRVRFVDSANEQAANSGAGDDEMRPWATLAYAISSASDGDTILLGPEHAETITGNLVCSLNRVAVIGMGSSGGEPTAVLTMAAGSLRFSGDNATIANVKMVAAADLVASLMLGGTGVNFLARDLVLEMGADMANTFGLSLTTTTSKRIERVTIRSVAEVGDVLPLQGLYCGSSACRIDIIDCVIDNGSAGFSFTGMEFSSSSTKFLNIENLTQLRGADVIVGADTVGRIGVSSAGGSARVRV
jgi:hypothetical protein